MTFSAVRRRCRARLGAARRRLFGPRVPAIVHAVRWKSLTYLDDAALVDLFEAVARADRVGEPGALIEVGCALGGSISTERSTSSCGGRGCTCYADEEPGHGCPSRAWNAPITWIGV